MIARITNMGNGDWVAVSRDGVISHNCGADYFPPAAIEATPNEGDAVYYEAELDREKGELVFGAESTEKVFGED